MIDQLIASRYRVIRELGRGGMGVVYLVEHTRTGDQLALKLLHGVGARDEQVIERFKREARASSRIKSEHVVKVVDADVAPELDGAPFLVMELLNGTDLDKQLKTEGPLRPDVALHYLAQAARALDKSHSTGIVHRDLKPENLFIHHREDGTTILKILDFGISKIVGGEGGNDIGAAGMTRTGSIMGTPLFMSPEQARGLVSEIGPATDVWAMGLVALQLLTGEIYWRANTVAELMVHILAEPLYPPSQRWTWLPPAIDGWFLHSCARPQSERFASVGLQIHELGIALGAHAGSSAKLAESGGSTLAAPPGSWPTAEAPGRLPSAIQGARTTTSAIAREGHEPPRNRASLLAGAAVLVLGGIGATVWTIRPHRNDGQGEPPLTTATTLATTPATAATGPVSTTLPSDTAPAFTATAASSAPIIPPQPATGSVTPSAAEDAGKPSHPQAGTANTKGNPGIPNLHPTAIVQEHPARPPSQYNPAAP
jgi:serine/threonine protein kinase